MASRRWWAGALLALGSTVVIGCWEAVVPHPGAEPRLVGAARPGEGVLLAGHRVAVVSAETVSAADVPAAERRTLPVADGGRLLAVTVSVVTARAGAPGSTPCEVRVRRGGQTWLPTATSAPCRLEGGVGSAGAELTAWFQPPPEAASSGGAATSLTSLVVEVRTLDADPRAVRLTP